MEEIAHIKQAFDGSESQCVVKSMSSVDSKNSKLVQGLSPVGTILQ